MLCLAINSRTHLDLLGGQDIHFVVDDGVQAEFLQQLDGILGVVIVAPAKQHQSTLLGQIHLKASVAE